MGKQYRRRWDYRSATAAASLDAGLSVITIRGVVTPRVVQMILEDNALWLAATGAAGQVADYREAALAVTADEMLGSAMSAHDVDAALASPTALLVNAQHQPMFCQYASLMARQGICRAPFLDVERAAQWARLHGPAYQELAAAARRAGSRPSERHTDAASLAHQAQRRSSEPI